MPRGYWITVYFKVSDPSKLGQYASLATPAIEAGGGRILGRGVAAATFEGGDNQRTVLIEFDSVSKAIAAYNSPAYQAAASLLKGAVDREVRIIEGL